MKYSTNIDITNIHIIIHKHYQQTLTLTTLTLQHCPLDGRGVDKRVSIAAPWKNEEWTKVSVSRPPGRTRSGQPCRYRGPLEGRGVDKRVGITASWKDKEWTKVLVSRPWVNEGLSGTNS